MKTPSKPKLMSLDTVHPAVPTDTPWSDEQLRILQDFAVGLDDWNRGFKESGPRMCIQAVAGSGKTTVLKAMLSIVREICPRAKTMASAFNVHIAQSLKAELVFQKRRGMPGAVVLGANNTMNAGGYSILKSECERRGLAMSMESSYAPKYRILSRQVWSEELGRAAFERMDYQGGYDWPILDAINQDLPKSLSHRQLWYKVARDLEKLVTVLQDEGFVPSTDAQNRKEVERIVSKVSLSRGLDDSTLWSFPSRHVPIDMACEVLKRGMTYAFSKDVLVPFAQDDRLCSSDAIVPRSANHPQTRRIRSEGRYDTALYPLWRLQTKEETSIQYWANKSQVIWPPQQENNNAHTLVSKNGLSTNVSFSFTDQIWLPYALDLSLEEDAFQIAFIDEIQDLSRTKGELYRRLLTDDGSATVILVGDTKQSIMGWSGATPDSVLSNADASGCEMYSMTYCWRGGHHVASSARNILEEGCKVIEEEWPMGILPAYDEHKSPDHINEWHDGKKEITITEEEVAHHVQKIRSSDPDATIAIVSRLNGALSPIIHQLTSLGVPIATPDSKEIVASIDWVLSNDYKQPTNKFQKPGLGLKDTKYTNFQQDNSFPSGSHFANKWSLSVQCSTLEKWLLTQAEERAGGDKEVAVMSERFNKERDALDLAQSLLALYISKRTNEKKTYDGSVNLKDFKTWVKKDLFGNTSNPVYLTSVHKYKGAEADYVFLLRSVMSLNRQSNTLESRKIFLLPHQVKNSFETAREECNILYVAATRAKIQNIQVIAGEQ